MQVSVRSTSIAAALVIVAILCAQAWLGLSRLAAVHDATLDLTTNRLAASELLGQIEAETIRHRVRTIRQILNAVPERDAEIVAQINSSTIRLADLFARYEARLGPGSDRSKWDAFQAAWKRYVPTDRAIADALADGDRAKAAEQVEIGRDDFLAATATLRIETQRNTEIAEAEAAAATRTYARASLEVIVFGILTVAAGVGIALFFVFRVSRPLAALTAAMGCVADGHHEIPVPATDRSDEIGEMARALVVFRDRLIETERIRAERAELDVANLRVISDAQEAEIRAVNEAREAISELAETLDAQVEEKTRHLVEREAEIVWRLSRATERRDNDTGAHIVRMGKICGLLAEALGLPETDCRKIEIATQMHDVGKVGIPDEILFKPGRLTPEERRIMETHAALGWEILKGSESRLIQLAADVALSHHEKWDGTGYPNGLAGEAIPLVGRIAALADVFDALMAVRPYKQAWPLDKALEFVREQSGKHFDPTCVEAFFGRIDDVLQVIEETTGDQESRVA